MAIQILERRHKGKIREQALALQRDHGIVQSTRTMQIVHMGRGIDRGVQIDFRCMHLDRMLAMCGLF